MAADSKPSGDALLGQLLTDVLDADWYARRYPDVIAAKLTPLIHFLNHGVHEWREPNAFFNGAWYVKHYPDIEASGTNPLVHYLVAGAAELRNPHPRFDAAWYVAQHPDAAANPLLYHLKTGARRGFPTEAPLDVADYLPAPPRPARRARRATVDVVIPVYRGLEETRLCLESVLANTTGPLGRVIVVEDRSPEPKLVNWLARLAAKGKIDLIRNERNLGFVRSVNAGMSAAGRHDVVLLNSDTEVPPGWLERLSDQAYADRRIASVSPLSNNATICSYPCHDGGPIAFGLPVADIDAACRKVNPGRFADVPTTVGYCMYIRRAALDAIGHFDAERFGLGYGEENDFCLRASERGWRHRLACDTFVYHKGSVSFGPKAQRLMKRATNTITKRFPDYARTIALHVARGEANPFRFALTAELFRRSKRPVILMVTHSLGGGVRRHVELLTERLAGQAHVLLLEGGDRGGSLSVPELPGHPTLALPAEALDDLVTLLRSFAVSRVHIHHLMGIDLDVRRLIRRLDVPFDTTVHDYFALCPQINLVPWRHSVYCGEPDIGGCNACIAHHGSHGARDIVTWRMQHTWMFRDADRVLCPSADTLDRLKRYGLAERAVVAPHEAVAGGTWPIRPPKLAARERLRVAVLGTLVEHKGTRAIAGVAALAGGRGVDIHLIGHIDSNIPAEAARRLKVTGRYQEEELPGLIKTIAPHVIWFPMSWPETYSFTLSAAIDSGAAIAAPRLGCFPERLAGRPLTWLADPGITPQGWIDLFATIATSLHGPRPRPARRPPVEDLPADRYLRPARRPACRSRPRVVILPERFDIGAPTPCAYIRLIQPLSHPSVTGEFDVLLADDETVLEERADIIVTQRYALADVAAAERLADHARSSGAKLVYDLDDDLVNIPKTHPDAAEIRPMAKVVRRMLELADAVWLSTPGLRARLRSLRPDALLMENRLDERIWTCRPPAPAAQDSPARILAMGTTSHEQDFDLIEPALVRLKAEYGNRVHIDILGMTRRTALPAGLSRPDMPHNAMGSYPAFVRWLSSAEPGWHIGLAPLLDTPFNASKSSIKAMDYAALGLAIVASDVDVYRGGIAGGPAGLLAANTPDDWYAALDLLVRDVRKRNRMMAAARAAFPGAASLAGHGTTPGTIHGTTRRDALHTAWHGAAPLAVSAA
ncbi:MAG TPA: glycosyltransferase [Rhodopila sp.]|uniref:glycosyltransferase n=1 Tax=Rhodopila sp. TaxID=2480087 RepID=UPI002B954390|nr:glycosyltransferase [Rhodopila sp.]HVY16945.1 glycosyltransferase [Rhodopila sp.]